MRLCSSKSEDGASLGEVYRKRRLWGDKCCLVSVGVKGPSETLLCDLPERQLQSDSGARASEIKVEYSRTLAPTLSVAASGGGSELLKGALVPVPAAQLGSAIQRSFTGEG